MLFEGRGWGSWSWCPKSIFVPLGLNCQTLVAVVNTLLQIPSVNKHAQQFTTSCDFLKAFFWKMGLALDARNCVALFLCLHHHNTAWKSCPVGQSRWGLGTPQNLKRNLAIATRFLLWFHDKLKEVGVQGNMSLSYQLGKLIATNLDTRCSRSTF